GEPWLWRPTLYSSDLGEDPGLETANYRTGSERCYRSRWRCQRLECPGNLRRRGECPRCRHSDFWPARLRGGDSRLAWLRILRSRLDSSDVETDGLNRD